MTSVVEPREELKDKAKIKVRILFGEMDQRMCYKCGEARIHIFDVLSIEEEGFEGNLYPRRQDVYKKHWILDSGSSRHLVNDLYLPFNSTGCSNE